MAKPKRRLRIAQVAPVIERVPPKKYGGTERMVYALTEGLVERGHDVTLFASGDSITTARLHSVYPKALREARFGDLYGLNMWTLLNVGEAFKEQNRFDIIHDHNAYISLPTANMARRPVITTFHGAITPYVRRIFSVLNKPHLVTISKSQAEAAMGLNHLATVYNGLDMESYPFSPTHDGYLLFVGRLSMEKGAHLAIEVAQYLNMPLILAAKLDDIDRSYFREYVEPRLSGDLIQWIGEVDTERRNELMSRARAFLHPVLWREPFGLTMIEAMACGTPVIAFNRGSIPEIVLHEETGFVVDTLDQMIDAVGRIDTISRALCRKHALETFSAERMVLDYERLYFQLVDEHSKSR